MIFFTELPNKKKTKYEPKQEEYSDQILVYE